MGTKTIKTIKAQGYADFKLSSPLDQPKEIKQAIREARHADQLVEFAHMRAFEVFRVLKFGKFQPTPVQIQRLDRATERLAEARTTLGDAVHQLEKLLAESGFSLPAKGSLG